LQSVFPVVVIGKNWFTDRLGAVLVNSMSFQAPSPAPSPVTGGRLCIHTITTKQLALERCLEEFPKRGATGITIWRQALEGRSLPGVAQQVRDAGLEVVSLCRGGFFPAADAASRRAAVDDNLRAIEQAHGIGAPLLVLVCGAVPGLPLEESRRQIADGIAAVLPAALEAGVRLAIEPLHPMYADDRSAVNTMRQAREICDALGSPASLGIAVDAYHVWWDPELEEQIALAGREHRLFAFHICDWLTPTTDLLNDRGLMGDGCINLRGMSAWVDAAGFTGHREVEIFSNRWWAADPGAFLDAIASRYQGIYGSATTSTLGSTETPP
jgi:sugar phosphate isomerase/epimerase